MSKLHSPFTVALVTSVFVTAFALRPCTPLPEWLTRNVLSLRMSALLFIMLIPGMAHSAAPSCTLTMMMLVTVITLTYGDFLIFQ